jgi:hypothetical protein
MAVSASDIKSMATELASVADATVEFWIAEALLSINVTAYGNKADSATRYLAAHYVTLAKKASTGASSGTGPIQQRKVGDASTTFAVGSVAAKDAMLASTVWGQMYLSLRGSVFPDRRV